MTPEPLLTAVRESRFPSRREDALTLDPTAALRLYGEAWEIPDYESRLELLRKIWADDGLYVDPDVPEGARGPEALASTIDTQFELYPGMSIVSGAPDVL